LRLDAHQHFTSEYTPDLLWPILKRNRFDGGIVVCGPADTAFHLELADRYDFIRGVIAAEYVDHPKLRGVWGRPPGLPNLVFETDDLASVPAIAEGHPGVRIVVQHLGRPHPLEAVERAAAYPNVFGKISGLITHCPTRWKADDFRPHVQHALRTFGPHRLMFGSDWPSYLPEGTFKEALAAFTQSIGALPLEMREQILGGTAERVYAL